MTTVVCLSFICICTGNSFRSVAFQTTASAFWPFVSVTTTRFFTQGWPSMVSLPRGVFKHLIAERQNFRRSMPGRLDSTKRKCPASRGNLETQDEFKNRRKGCSRRGNEAEVFFAPKSASLLRSPWDTVHFACSTECFPLTLTLCLREREQQASDWCF